MTEGGRTGDPAAPPLCLSHWVLQQLMEITVITDWMLQKLHLNKSVVAHYEDYNDQ